MVYQQTIRLRASFVVRNKIVIKFLVKSSVDKLCTSGNLALVLEQFCINLKLIYIYIYLCGFAERCPLSFRLNTGFVVGKNHGACRLARCQQRAQTYPWVGG